MLWAGSRHGARGDKRFNRTVLLAPSKPHIAWLTCRIARVQYANFSAFLELRQLWIADLWHERFGMPADPRDYGSRHRQTREQVDAFTITDKQLLFDCHDTNQRLSRDGHERRVESRSIGAAIFSTAHA